MSTHSAVVIGAVLCAVTTHARLDYIDADGVTERGGTPAQARMLPRTGADGRLSASLLPSAEDWAAQPMPMVYFVDAQATSAGNGSARTPFRSITDAAAAVPSGSALLLAPGNYSGTITLQAGAELTLMGFGRSSYLNDLTVTAEGESPSTRLHVHSVSGSRLAINGGTLGLRLYNVQLTTLDGLSTKVTVRRYDLGTTFSAVNLVPLSDSYEGKDTIAYAENLRGASPAEHLHMSGNRPVVGDETCAFLSDVTSTSNAVYVTFGEFHATDTNLYDRIANEASERKLGDAELGTSLTNTANALRSEISGIGTGWQTQLATITTALGTLSSSLSALSAREAEDVEDLEAEDIAVRSAFASADNTVKATLRSETTTKISQLEANIPAIATEYATNAIALQRQGIINDAKNAVQPAINTLSASVSSLNATVGAHATAIGTITSRISTIASKVNEIITVVNARHGTAITPLPSW